MQLAGSGNGTPPCHRPITEHAGRVRRQLPSDGNRRAVRGKRGAREGGRAGVVVVVVVVQEEEEEEEEDGGH